MATAERLLSQRLMTCGFCSTGHHQRCSVASRNGASAPNKVWICPCSNPECEQKTSIPRCIECHDTSDVNKITWACNDLGACHARIDVRLAGNPSYQRIKLIQESAKMTEATEKAPRTPAAPKVGVCLVTGKPTKGGKFLPGMDARYVSNKVQAVLAGETTEVNVLKEMKGHGLTETLQGKFVKALGLAREKAAKAKATEKAKAEAAKVAAAEKAKAPASA